MRFYVLTSTNYEALLRHNDPTYSNIHKDDMVVVINSLDSKYIERAKNYCIAKDIKYSSYDTFKNYYGLSHEKSVYFDSLTTKYYAEQQKYSEGSEVHCRVTWLSKKAAEFKFDEDVIIGEDTLQMLELKHEALEGRLSMYTTDEKPATYIYDERNYGTVVIETNFGEDCEWMDTYLNALKDMEHVDKLHENTRLPELEIEYPQDYVYNDLGLTKPDTYTLKVAA